MIPVQLQDDLIAELKVLLREELFKKENYDQEEEDSTKYIPLNIYAQNLLIESSREGDNSLFPYMVVKLDRGTISNYASAHEVNVVIVLGIFDDSRDAQGHRDVLHIINMIYERFAKNPMLNHKYMAKLPFNWALQDEDTEDYYFGGIEMTFEIPALKKEDEFA